MNVRLSNDDRCAVDLLLEQSQPPSPGMGSCFTNAPSSDMQERLARVEALLHVLDQFSPAEPPGDLVSATLARCDQSAAAVPQPPPDSGTSRSIASAR